MESLSEFWGNAYEKDKRVLKNKNKNFIRVRCLQ
jgi:hypothetical protein